PSSRSRRRPPQRPPGVLWDVYDALIQNAAMGLLVTERGGLDRVVAYVDTASGHTTPARDLAVAIARDFTLLDRRDDWPHLDDPRQCVDLRHCGRPDSAKPVPGFVYGLLCRRRGAAAGRSYSSPRPFCRFLLAEIDRSWRGAGVS